MTKRPDFIRNWHEIEAAQSDERFGHLASFSQAMGLSRLKMAHLRLPPGRVSHRPGAYRDEEEFFFVLEGTPDLWVDGHLYRLKEGDGVAINDNTGISHSLINNTDKDVRLFVFGEGTRLGSQFFLPLADDAAGNERLKKMGKLWENPPKRKLGPNGGEPGDLSGRKRGLPAHVVQWRDILQKKMRHYPHSDEDQTLDAPFGNRARFSRVGIRAQLLKAGRRTSWPHAERDEDEFVYVVSGKVDAWNDGDITPMGEGDFIGWRAGTGIAHVIINNSDDDVVLLVGGEASRMKARVWYAFHRKRNKEIGETFWADHPTRKLGPHDGLPDALRARVPAARRKDAVSANEAAKFLGERKKKK